MEESQNVTTVLQSCSPPPFKRHSLPLHRVHNLKSKAVSQECSSDIFIQYIVPYSLKAKENYEDGSCMGIQSEILQNGWWFLISSLHPSGTTKNFFLSAIIWTATEHFWSRSENLEASRKFLKLANSKNTVSFSMFQRKSPTKPSVHCTILWSVARIAKRWAGPRTLTSSNHVTDVASYVPASQKVLS